MNTSTTPKDFFLHLGATIALYASVIALLNLAFQITNRLLPDQLSGYFAAGSIVWPISMLVVMVPILYLIEWLIARDIAKIPEKKGIWIRRWRIYLTLFLTGATIAGDLVVLINVYLNGEITARFVWKILIVLVVCSTVFKYYFFSVNESPRWSALVKKTVPWFGIILVLAAIIGGFVIVGSPATQRAIRFDQQRVSNLSAIQWQIVSYWQKKSELPVALSDLNDPISGYVVPVDPETGAAYGYSVKGVMGVQGSPSGLSFELCADFSLPSSEEPADTAIYNMPMIPAAAGNIAKATWDHSAGQTCFDRMLDTALYPVTKPVGI